MNLHRKLLWISGIAALLLFGTMQVILCGLTPNVVALQLSFTPDAFRQVLNAWQPLGVGAYRHHLPFDFAFLVCYGAFGYLLATGTNVFGPREGQPSRQIAWMLPGAAVFDACENFAHLILLSSDNEMTPMLVAISATCSLLKWLLAIAYTVIAGKAMVMQRQSVNNTVSSR